MRLVDRARGFPLLLEIWAKEFGVKTLAQDLIEYALMAAFLAVAAAAVMPGVATGISRIFSAVATVLSTASTTGS
jgi:Flp pilus assembly pilin Flp